MRTAPGSGFRWGTVRIVQRTPFPDMRFNPRLDPFVEASYFGYSLRGVAHRQWDRSFTPSLEIRDYRYGEGEILYEHAFSECFGDADTAIAWALGKGRRVIDDLLESMNRDEWIEM